MLIHAAIKAIQVYGIAIAISMVVAVLIKLMVVVTSRVKPAARAAAAPLKTVEPAATKEGIPDEVVVALSAVIGIVTGSHRILHIAESKRSWSHEGRVAQHSSHQPRH